MKTKTVNKLKCQLPGILVGIARGEKAIRQGRIYSEAQATDKLSKWLK